VPGVGDFILKAAAAFTTGLFDWRTTEARTDCHQQHGQKHS